MRLFGALANAASQYDQGRFKRKQYDDEQARQEAEAARRAFEFAATNDRLKEQMDLSRQSRQDMLDQRKQEEERRQAEDIAKGIQGGFESAPYEEASSAANAFLQSQGMGMPNQAVKAPKSARRPIMVEGQDMGAPDLQAAPEYTRIGGRLMRYDAQKQANVKADEAARKFMAQSAIEKLKSKGDVNEIIARSQNAYHAPQGDWFTDPVSKQPVWVNKGQNAPPGYTKVGGAGAGAGRGGGRINSGERDKLMAIQEIRRLAQDAETKTTGVDGFAGPIDRRLQSVYTMLGAPDIKVQEAMRAYQRLAAPAARSTIGTAMTPQEIKRLDAWLPMLENSDEKVVRMGIQGFKKEADAIYNERIAMMKASGIDTSELEKLPAQFDAVQNGSPPKGTSPVSGPSKSGLPWIDKKEP